MGVEEGWEWEEEGGERGRSEALIVYYIFQAK